MHSIFALLLILMSTNCSPKKDQAVDKQPDQTFSTKDYPVYERTDLGLSYSKAAATFRLWAPTAQNLRLLFYRKDLGGEAFATHDMVRADAGSWRITLAGDWKGTYYCFQAKINDQWMKEVPDPYAKAVGTNGKRAVVVNLSETNPPAWEDDRRPNLENFNDILLYELHVRDLSSHPNSSIVHKGKFLGLTEMGTKSPEGLSTGLDHIKELGITHVHLLPSFDFGSVDERYPDKDQFNWGYDPINYNVPEGSYSTDPASGEVRIREFKQMVQQLHRNGLRVVMDVVYNHTFSTEESCFDHIVPGYYYRQNIDGTLSNASGCGNETASERPMVRKFILESVLYWAREYHIDGFRFDLMGIHDIETMNLIRKELDKIDPSIFIYGEGWTASGSPLDEEQRALKQYTYKLDRIAAFSDDIRDAIKGHWSDEMNRGFVSGAEHMEESIKFGVVAATKHPQIKYELVNYSKKPWAAEPYQSINYVSCHDNHTLWDKLALSVPEATAAQLLDMHKLSNAIVLTAQGVPLFHAGVELARTKFGDHNSYKSPDSINRIDWSRKETYYDLFQYYKDMVSLRKAHPAFRMTSSEQIIKHLSFLDTKSNQVVAFHLRDHANGDSWEQILVIYNARSEVVSVPIPDGTWQIKADKNGLLGSSAKEFTGKLLSCEPISVTILAGKLADQ